MRKIVNGQLVDPKCSYRIKNNFVGSENSFWYSIHSNNTELNSNCQLKQHAKIYLGSEIIENSDVIKQYSTAVLMEV